MTESGLQVLIVPLRTAEDRRLFGLALDTIRRIIYETILEIRGYTKGEIDEWMGRDGFDPDRADNPGAGAVGRTEFLQAIGGEG